MPANMLRKLERTSDDTYAKLNRRLNSIPMNWADMLPEDVYKFIDMKAKSVSSCTGYFIACLLAATSYVVSLTSTVQMYTGHEVRPNVYLLLNGPPTTSKSAVIRDTVVVPLKNLMEVKDIAGLTLQNCTSAALTKHLAKFKHGVLTSPEIYDLLRKLVKSDAETASGDISILCSLFSGEEVNLSFATEAERTIPAKTPFSIIGAIQTPASAKLFSMVDNGQGLVDRFLFLSPLPVRPSPNDTAAACDDLKTMSITDFSEVLYEIHSIHEAERSYHFDETAKITMIAKEEAFIAELNDALMEGLPTPKNKTTDQVYRLALAIHVLSRTISSLLKKEKPVISTSIPNECVVKATQLVEYGEAQKGVLLTFIQTAIQDKDTLPSIDQPTAEDIKAAILQIPGPIVTPRAFKSVAPRPLRQSTTHEVVIAMKNMPRYGDVHEIKVKGQGKLSVVYVKKAPADVQHVAEEDDTSSIVSEDQYAAKYGLPSPASIGPSLRQQLVSKNLVSTNALNGARAI